jgi:2-keto-4-pentenoate hydratase/2-oxohepta-3-ene-1,7-dioic acid hydratase in catechol pathway
MRFISVQRKGIEGTGIITSLNATTAKVSWAGTPGYVGSLDALVKGGNTALQATGAKLLGDEEVSLADVELLAPLRSPGKIVCIGLNYADHSAESGFATPTYPAIFSRYASSLMGAGAPMLRPKVSEQLDYEGELAVVIGKGGRHISKESALEHVLGYSVFNDGSVRDFQFKSAQWTMGKNFDNTGAFGPALVTADELPAGAKGLKLQTRLNGQVVQNANIDDMIFDVATLISLLSVAHALEPGDVIVSGTPAGVGLARKPPLWMKPGDVCEVEIERVGLLRTPVTAE